ncbi:MAG TPA: TIGR00730 family Rossman fold protein [Lacunisphaera sp.]
MIKSKLTCLLLVSFILAAPLLHAGVPPATRVAAQLSICVYCGASDRADPKYAAVARELGEALARRQWTLVWGGGQTGLMGAVARGAKETGGRVVGIIPEFIRQWEVAYKQADEMMVVTTMAERKILLQTRSDVFVILPGGVGTLDEISDTLDLKNLSQHHKPIILLNQDGYYDTLLAFLDHSIAEKFSKNEARGQFMVARSVEEVLTLLEDIDRASLATR